MNDTEIAALPEPIDSIYIGECPSTSGQSTLTYAVGRRRGDNTLHLRITDNTGHGMWCKDWASAQAIEDIVIGAQELTAKSFHCLHPGKSINTGGFVLAALRDLGLIRPNEVNTRLHVHVPKATLEQTLMHSMQAQRGEGIAAAAPKTRRKAKVAV